MFIFIIMTQTFKCSDRYDGILHLMNVYLIQIQYVSFDIKSVRIQFGFLGMLQN